MSCSDQNTSFHHILHKTITAGSSRGLGRSLHSTEGWAAQGRIDYTAIISKALSHLFPRELQQLKTPQGVHYLCFRKHSLNNLALSLRHKLFHFALILMYINIIMSSSDDFSAFNFFCLQTGQQQKAYSALYSCSLFFHGSWNVWFRNALFIPELCSIFLQKNSDSWKFMNHHNPITLF